MGENLSSMCLSGCLILSRSYLIFICFDKVQGKDPSVEVTQDIIEESEDERFDDMSDTTPPIELPPCEISHLEEIKEVSQIHHTICKSVSFS